MFKSWKVQIPGQNKPIKVKTILKDLARFETKLEEFYAASFLLDKSELRSNSYPGDPWIEKGKKERVVLKEAKYIADLYCARIDVKAELLKINRTKMFDRTKKILFLHRRLHHAKMIREDHLPSDENRAKTYLSSAPSRSDWFLKQTMDELSLSAILSNNKN